MINDEETEQLDFARKEKPSSKPLKIGISINETSGSLKEQLIQNIQVSEKGKGKLPEYMVKAEEGIFDKTSNITS